MGRFSFTIVILIVFATVLNFFDRGAISYAILPIQRDLNLSELQFGWIGGGWGIGYFSMAFFAGILVDRFGSIELWALSVFLWSLVTFFMGLVEGFASFFLLRILLGITEGIHFAALLRTIADWLEMRWRARALAFSLIGMPLACAISAPFLTWLLQWLGWRRMFFFIGALGIIWVFLWLLLFRGKKNPHLSLSTLPFCSKLQKFPWKELFTSLPFLANCLIFYTFGCVLLFGLIWLPGFLEKTYRLSIEETGFFALAPWLLSVAFAIFGGWVSDSILKRTGSPRKARPYLIFTGFFFATFWFILLALSERFGMGLTFLSLGLASVFFAIPATYSFNIDLFPSHPGTAQGINNLFFALGGISSSTLTGWFVQTTGSFDLALFFIAAVSATAACIALIFQKPAKNQ